MLSLQKIKFIFCLVLCHIFSVSIAYAQMESKAEYGYMVDYHTGTVLFSKNAEQEMSPSSMTKLMTLYILFDQLKQGEVSLDTEFHVSETAWRKGGSKMYVKEGSKVSIEDLIKGIIVASGNDACIVVAEGIAGSEEAFVEDMNFKAEKMELVNSRFKNVTGWPDPEHKMSAKDLVTLSIKLYEDFPEYYKYFAEKTFKYSKIKQNNRNLLLFKDSSFDGLKTGHTEEAGYGIAISAQKDERRIFLAINGLKSNKERIQEAERLIRRGFVDHKYIELYPEKGEVYTANIWFGKGNKIKMITDKKVRVLANKRISKKQKVELTVTYKDPIIAPVDEGRHIGDLTITTSGKVSEVVPLYAAHSVPGDSFFGKAISKFKYMIFGY